MARVFPQAAISSPYMSTERETFTVWMKSLVYQTNGLTVYNSNGEITYRVENYDKSSNEVHIMDLHGNILFTIRKKIIDTNGDIIAQVKPKQSSNGITLGEDVLTLEVKPRVDHSLVVTLVTVYGLIKGVV
ncbi:unnamed protein product [Thlaspi arvense]|uniref:Uncharacterized protein n=1 Tax=Thlaspi arvense TaxID=13288 RepID=A0AAU9RR25_THLAR|nr:unnamed protein product [Thlaspi arvense]